MTASQYVLYISLWGIMGVFGQGIRVIAGLKKSGSLDASNPKSEFDAAFMLISLMTGAIAGIAAGLIIDIPTTPIGPGYLLSIAAAGYAGADFTENMTGMVLNRMPQQVAMVQQNPVKATEVKFVNSTSFVPTGGSIKLTLLLSPENALQPSGSWSSANMAIATVTNGLVTGISAGTTTITFQADNNGPTATCSLTVI